MQQVVRGHGVAREMSCRGRRGRQAHGVSARRRSPHRGSLGSLAPACRHSRPYPRTARCIPPLLPRIVHSIHRSSYCVHLQGSLALRLCLPRSRSGLVLAPLAVIDICIRLALPPKPASESATQPTTTRQAAERPAADHHHDAALPSRESRISHLRAPGQVAPDRPLVALRTARRRPSLLSYRHPPARPSRTRTHTCAPAANCPPALRKASRSRATLWRACLPAPECL
jgi:hypothetical protein